MFERYIETKDFLQIPISGRLYYINVNGVVQNKDRMEISSYLNKNGEKVVKINWLNGYKEYKVDLLIAFTFKPVSIPVKFWNKLTLLYKDGNRENIHPSNLIWKYPVGGIECIKNPNYFYIPGFSRYVIDKKGNVIKYLFSKRMSYYVNELGYFIFTLQNDLGKRITIGRHRLLCLTFTDYPFNIDDLHVNHIDGIPGNDDLLNLEWTTPKGNNHHSLKNRKIISNKVIEAKNLITGEINEYFSNVDISYLTGISNGLISRYLSSNDQRVLPNGYQIKYKYNRWKEQTNVEEDIKKANFRNKVLVKNILTNEVMEFESASKCASYYGLSELTISVRLRNNKQKLYPGYLIFKRKYDETPWRVVPNPEKELSEGCFEKSVYCKDIISNQVKFFNTLIEASVYTKFGYNRIKERADMISTYPCLNFEFNYKNDSWRKYTKDQLEIIDLSIKQNKCLIRDFGYKITDIKTNLTNYYISAADITDVLGIQKCQISYIVRNKKVFRNKYIIEQIKLT